MTDIKLDMRAVGVMLRFIVSSNNIFDRCEKKLCVAFPLTIAANA